MVRLTAVFYKLTFPQVGRVLHRAPSAIERVSFVQLADVSSKVLSVIRL